jgi:hypothetical protein
MTRNRLPLRIDVLCDGAESVLRANDRGHMTVAAPALYPHMWSWDAAFVAIGLAQLSIPRAIVELRSLLAGQWRTGMIPHILFSSAQTYFPGPERWGTSIAPAAPAGVSTSGISQPPVHAIAVSRIVERARRLGGADRVAAEDFLRSTFDDWFRWHDWLAGARGVATTGMVEIRHGWESGLDNSPRWDLSYARVAPGPMQPFRRTDTTHVNDAQRPSDEEYSRYAWLVDQLRASSYDDECDPRTLDFRVRDVLMTAILSEASEVLAELGDSIGRHSQAADLRSLAKICRHGVTMAISPVTGLARDYDARAGEWLHTATVAGFAPLLCSDEPAIRRLQLRLLQSPMWMGYEQLALALPPSTSPASPAFRQTAYWRGPVWPVISWLLWWGLDRHGDHQLAEQIRQNSLIQLAGAEFAEYYDPFSAAPLGSRSQSWTAAVALDWLATDSRGLSPGYG